jgi:hypothetical protein
MADVTLSFAFNSEVKERNHIQNIAGEAKRQRSGNKHGNIQQDFGIGTRLIRELISSRLCNLIQFANQVFSH